MTALHNFLDDRKALKLRFNCDVFFVASDNEKSRALFERGLISGNSGKENRGIVILEF
jgi:hypothetical protein